jgi:hypothetical protein
MNRVLVLEETVEKLNKQAFLSENELKEDGENFNDKMSRNEAMKEAIKEIRKHFPEPDYKVEIIKKEITTIKNGEEERKIISVIEIKRFNSNRESAIVLKFNHSNTTYLKKEKIEIGMHRIDINEVLGGSYDLCIFSMKDINGNFNFFFMTPSEVGEYKDYERENSREDLIESIEKDKPNKLIFNFNVKGDKAYDYYNVKKNADKKVKEVTKFLNRWEVIDEI